MIVVVAEAVPILSLEGNICVQFGRAQIWCLGGLGGRITSICPHLDLILDDCLES